MESVKMLLLPIELLASSGEYSIEFFRHAAPRNCIALHLLLFPTEIAVPQSYNIPVFYIHLCCVTEWEHKFSGSYCCQFSIKINRFFFCCCSIFYVPICCCCCFCFCCCYRHKYDWLVQYCLLCMIDFRFELAPSWMYDAAIEETKNIFIWMCYTST